MNKSLIGLAVAGAAAVSAFAATAAKADVYVYRPYPYYAYRRVVAGPVVVAPGYYPRCTWRTTRVWINGRYVSRRVRTCW
jgi:hypothetical protein